MPNNASPDVKWPGLCWIQRVLHAGHLLPDQQCGFQALVVFFGRLETWVAKSRPSKYCEQKGSFVIGRHSDTQPRPLQVPL